MNKKLSILLVASFFAAILSANSVSAAKYTVENVENNPQYRFLSQRLVRLEIDEDEEIDFEELAKNIFVPSKTKCPVAKAWNGLNAKTAQISVGAHLSLNIANDTSSDEERAALGDKIKKLQKDKSFSSGNINSSIAFSTYYEDLDVDDIEFTLHIREKYVANYNYPKHPDGYIKFHVLNESPTIYNYEKKEYLDLSIINPYPGQPLNTCTSFIFTVSENFELIIKRKPQTIENPDIDSQDKKEETLQEIQENSPTTESASIPIQAPNTGHSTNFAPLITVAALTTTTGFFFIKKR